MSDPMTNAAMTDCCAEFSRLSRRGVLRGSLGALTVGGLATTIGSAVVTTAPAYADQAGAADDGVLVVLSLRGAADGLSLVVPHGDPVYAKARPRIAIPAPRLLEPDAHFGLHPALAPLVPMWRRGEIAAIHATGMRVPNRSHFAAMEELEDADPGSSVRVGWLNRLVGLADSPTPLTGVAIGGTLPTSLAGPQPVMSMRSIGSSSLSGTDGFPGRTAALRLMWGQDPSAMGTAVRAAIDSADTLGAARSLPDNAPAFPNSDLGRALASVSRTIRADVGVGVVTVDHGDWDMHTWMGTADSGQMRTNTAELAAALAAFFADLGDQAPRVTMVALSEFGRRTTENSGGGLDHGWGNVMFVLGAGVRGGYYGRWPGLTEGPDGDLAVTTDYRDVLAEVIAARTSASVATVFPGRTGSSTLGFMGPSNGGPISTPVTLTPPAPSTPPVVPTAGTGDAPDERRRRRAKRRRRRRRARDRRNR